MKNIFILLISVIAMSMFTFASCENENDEPQPQETGYDTFRYEVTGRGKFPIYFMDSTKTQRMLQIEDGDGIWNTLDTTYWSYEFRVEKPYTAVVLSLHGGDDCMIYMNGEPLDIVPTSDGQLVKIIKGSLYPNE